MHPAAVTLRLPQRITHPLSLLADGVASARRLTSPSQGLTYRHNLCIRRLRQSRRTEVPQLATSYRMPPMARSQHMRTLSKGIDVTCDGEVAAGCGRRAMFAGGSFGPRWCAKPSALRTHAEASVRGWRRRRVARLSAQSPPTGGSPDPRRLPGRGCVVGWMTVGCCWCMPIPTTSRP